MIFPTFFILRLNFAIRSPRSDPQSASSLAFDAPHPSAKEKHQWDRRRGAIMFRIKPCTCQRCLEGANKALCTPGSRERISDLHKRLTVLPLSVWVSPAEARSAMACRGERSSGYSRPWRHSVWDKSSRRRSALAPPKSRQADNPQTGEQLYQRSSCMVAKVLEPTTDSPTWGSGKGTENPQGIWLWRPVGFHCRISTGLGNRLLEGATNLFTSGPRRKEQWPCNKLSQTCLWVPWSLRRRCGLTVASCGVRALTTTDLGAPECWRKSFWKRLPLPLPEFGLRPDYREGTQPHPSAENWIKNLLGMTLPTGARPSFPHSQSLPSGSFHKPLILIHQKADRMKTTITEN